MIFTLGPWQRTCIRGALFRFIYAEQRAGLDLAGDSLWCSSRGASAARPTAHRAKGRVQRRRRGGRERSFGKRRAAEIDGRGGGTGAAIGTFCGRTTAFRLPLHFRLILSLHKSIATFVCMQIARSISAAIVPAQTRCEFRAQINPNVCFASRANKRDPTALRRSDRLTRLEALCRAVGPI